MKKFLNKNAPNNILNYFDSNKGIDASFVKWYESDIRNSKNIVYSSAYKVVLAKPKIEWWVHTKMLDVVHSIEQFVKKVKR